MIKRFKKYDDLYRVNCCLTIFFWSKISSIGKVVKPEKSNEELQTPIAVGFLFATHCFLLST